MRRFRIGRLRVRPGVVVGLGALAGVFVAACASSSKAQHAFGLRLEDDRLFVTSYDRWIAEGSAIVKSATHDGAASAEQIVTAVLREVFPARAWPPVVDSPLSDQYAKMVDFVRPFVREPAKVGTPLRVVSDD